MPAPSAALAAPASVASACSASLAQGSPDSMLPVFGWSLVLIALLVVGFFAISKLRQWLKDDAPMAGPAIGFTLSDLRQLHRQGKMTDEEFERARSKMVGAAKAMAAKMPDPLARGERKRPPAAGDVPDVSDHT